MSTRHKICDRPCCKRLRAAVWKYHDLLADFCFDEGKAATLGPRRTVTNDEMDEAWQEILAALAEFKSERGGVQ